MQIPFAARQAPHAKAGEASLRCVRKISNGPGRVVMIVVTGYRSDAIFVWRMRDLEADLFLDKSTLTIPELTDGILERLQLAGREDHASCAACNARSRPAESDARAPIAPIAPAASVGVAGGAVEIVIDGERRGRRSCVTINGQLREMQDKIFLVFLRLVVAHERDAQAWSGRDELGVGAHRHVTTGIRTAFRGLLPEGFDALEADHSRQLRLNPALAVVRVAWARLLEHPDAAVQKVARAQMKVA